VADKWSPSSRRNEALVQLLRTADILWEVSRIFFARWDLSPSQFNVLNLLDGSPEGLSQTELGRELLTHRSNITGLVDRLEKRGLVRRKEVPGDRRAYRVILAPAGAGLVQEILPEYRERADHVWDGLPPEKIFALSSIMEHVSSNAMNAAIRTKPKARRKKA
jgi:MarR family 2-MHQ and catechol resistance regulon transcriptional repressor